ncbi:MAG: 3-hydroxyacyl-ACP dehydratase FabZ [Burkholderiales bacterium]
MTNFEATDVLSLLPQRYPLIMIDRVVSCEPGKRLVAIKNVSHNEPQFLGHFPGRPIMPGVLMLEAMAQASGILVFLTRGQQPSDKAIYFLAGIDNARFKRPVVPGDQIELESTVAARKRTIWKFNCIARVGGAVCAEADVLCTERLLGQE